MSTWWSPHRGCGRARPLLASAAAAGIEVIGEVELAWRMDRARPDGPRPWLVVTGTNGKTTTTGMLESMLRAAGLTVTACGNIGWSAAEAVADPTQQVIAAELSSFQLHGGAVGAAAGRACVLNLAEDHLDWHGSMAAYAAAKARALTGEVAVAVIDDPAAAALLAAAPAPRRVGVTGRIAGGRAARRDRRACWSTGRSAHGELRAGRPSGRPGAHNVTNALAAAALALAGTGWTATRSRPGCGRSGRAGTATCRSPRSAGCATSTTPRRPTRTPRPRR